MAIAILKNDIRGKAITRELENATVHITTVTLFELLLRRTNMEAVEEFRNNCILLDFDEEAARQASRIFKELKEIGKIVDMRDIYIAAICCKLDYALVTLNKKHFQNMKGLRMI